MAFEPFIRRSNIEANLALSEGRARRAEAKAKRNDPFNDDLLKPKANMQFQQEQRRLGPFTTLKQSKIKARESELFRSFGDQSEFEQQGQAISGIMSRGAEPPQELRDTLANIFEERQQRQNFTANIALLGGFASGLGAKVRGGGKAIRNILKNRQPTTLQEALEVQAQLTGKQSAIFPIGSGARTDPLPGSGKTLRLINVNGRLQQVFVDDETIRIQNLLQLLRSL